MSHSTPSIKFWRRHAGAIGALLAAALLVMPLVPDAGRPAAVCAADPPPAVKFMVAGREAPVKVLGGAGEDVIVSVTDPAIADLLKLFGASAAWSDQENTWTVTKGRQVTIYAVGKSEMTVDGKPVILATPLTLINGQPALPLSGLCLAVGARLVSDEAKTTWYLDPVVTGMTLAGESGRQTLTVNATGPMTADCFTLTKPDRYVVDLPNAVLAAGVADMADSALGPIRIAQNKKAPNVVRLVIPMASGVEVDPAAAAHPGQVAFAIHRSDVGPAVQNGKSQTITDVRVSAEGGDVVLTIQASGPMEYQWHRLRAPDNRFFIDLPRTTLAVAQKSFSLQDAAITEIEAAQFAKDPVPVTRVVLRLRQPVVCAVAPVDGQPNTLVIRIGHAPVDPLAAVWRGQGLTSVQSTAGRVICIDAGHGGSDPGALNQTLGIQEKEMTLDVAKRLAALMTRKGWTVVLTRTKDQELAPGAATRDELEARCQMASDFGADLFLSIHCNSAANRDATGASTYYYKEEDYALADAVLASLTAATGRSSRGLHKNRFYVLAHTAMPAVLVETAFISSPEDGALLNQPKFRQKVAEGICQGLIQYAVHRWSPTTGMK